MEKPGKAENHIGLLDRTEKLLSHTKEIESTNINTPEYVVNYLNKVLENCNLQESDDKSLKATLDIISRFSYGNGSSGVDSLKSKKNTEIALKEASLEISIRKQIEEYYLPKQLVKIGRASCRERV